MLPVQPFRGRYQRPDLRNHRKLLVADGELAYLGSLNLIDPSYDKRANRRRGLAWKDLLAEVRGPVVHEIDAVLITDWYSETDELLTSSREQSTPEQRHGSLLAQIAPSGPGFATENNLSLFNTLIYYAQHRLSITSPCCGSLLLHHRRASTPPHLGERNGSTRWVLRSGARRESAYLMNTEPSVKRTPSRQRASTFPPLNCST